MKEKRSTKMETAMKNFIEKNHYNNPHDALFLGAYLSIQSLDFFLENIEDKLSDKSVNVNTGDDGITFIQEAHEARKLMSILGGNAQRCVNGGAPIFGRVDIKHDCDSCDEKEDYATRKEKEQKA